MSLRSLRSFNTSKQIHIPGVDCLFVRWAPHYTTALSAQVLDVRHHPKHEQIKRRWESRSDPLWWNCLTTTKAGGNKKIVRAWLNNRAKVAITNALKSKGYAKNGARLLKEAGNSARGDLVGSLHVLVLPHMLHTSWEDLSKQAEIIVAAVEERQIQDNSQNQVARVGRREASAGAQNQKKLKLDAWKSRTVQPLSTIRN
jgi:hypothetical protein